MKKEMKRYICNSYQLISVLFFTFIWVWVLASYFVAVRYIYVGKEVNYSFKYHDMYSSYLATPATGLFFGNT